jgi:hypothetical protein
MADTAFEIATRKAASAGFFLLSTSLWLVAKEGKRVIYLFLAEPLAPLFLKIGGENEKTLFSFGLCRKLGGKTLKKAIFCPRNIK